MTQESKDRRVSQVHKDRLARMEPMARPYLAGRMILRQVTV